MYNNPFAPSYQPYQQFQPYQQQQPQPQQVTRVNGQNGANAYAIGANSSALLLDESGTMVWLVVTDGAGYKTVTPYDITPHQSAPAPDYSSLEQRIARLEEMIHDPADSSATQRKPKPGAGAD